ncbi:MAG: hypothetical protein ABSA92_10585 [Candidatus Bathyarchaeia archaeon]
MTGIALRVLVLLSAIVVISLIAYPTLVKSQSENAQVSMALHDLQRAESAGATSTEMQRLIDQMNSIIGLQSQLQNLPVQDTETRVQLLSQINATLTSIDSQANRLEVTASQRTYMGHVIAYSSGVVGAVIATAAYYYGLILYRRYRIKRTFQMKIIPK